MKNGYYHVYNRGVEKRNIFVDDLDYEVFLKYLKEYLEPKDEDALLEVLGDKTIDWSEKDKALKLLKLNNFSVEIELIAFCLMPNHFHLLIKQNKWNSMDSFTNSILTRYASYFNRRHKRVGRLFQDVYKAVLINSEPQLLHLSRYIHQNPTKLKGLVEHHQHAFTSLPEFLNKRQTGWVKPQTVLSYFSKSPGNNSYETFVSQPSDNGFISNILIEDPA